ncbi:MAG: host-nuclease inhibitor Gam family protein [Verrucomicrobiota bacterium]
MNQNLNPDSVQLLPDSPDAFQSAVADLVRLKLDLASRQAHRDSEVAEVHRRHEPALAELARRVRTREAALHLWCSRHRHAFGPRKSLELPLAALGFETCPPRVEKLDPQDTWPAIARRLETLAWGRQYLTREQPEICKARLLADRRQLSPEQLAEAGLRIAQQEQFFFRPKSTVAEDAERAGEQSHAA